MTTLVLPARNEEAWRWADLSRLPALAEAAPTAIRPEPRWIGLGGPHLVFVDGVFDAAASDPGRVALGAVDAATGHPLGRLATGEGWTLTLAADAVADPVEIVHIATGGASHLPARIALADDAVAHVVETFIGAGWSNRLTAISLGRSARLMRSVRLLQDSGFVSLRDEVRVGEGASHVAIMLGAGGADSRIDAHIDCIGEAAFAEMGGALLTRGKQRQEAAVVVRHSEPSGQSRQIWRAVAADASTASLAARVEVARDAQKTDGEQSLRGLLLQRSATVNLKPELEIFADDVKCAHGATVGELDARALFYLESRGIEPARARALLTRAFVADALDRIGEEKVRETFAADADAWLAGL
ncbi:SufB/SufD family protein [Sphingomonas gilva]|uniref:SufB/SufD family protein n=1 Tax=Sphingomonas gilva TaxID=2305907 RepID=UPI001FEA9E1D|nr:SufD family Fe-S cluster assembly protein [Sphingomonas gilva]